MAVTTTTSLLDRAGLDRARTANLLSAAWKAQTTANCSRIPPGRGAGVRHGRLKQATYDTAQGFGLRAVKGEAVGYAHASDGPRRQSRAPSEAVRAVQGGYSGNISQAPARTNVRFTATRTRSESPSFETKVKLLEEIDAFARAKDPRVRQVSVSFGATWQVVEILRADGETLPRRAAAGAP